MILPHLISIAMRRYAAEPQGRDAAARMLLLNATRLAVHHLGRKEAAQIALAALYEKQEAA